MPTITTRSGRSLVVSGVGDEHAPGLAVHECAHWVFAEALGLLALPTNLPRKIELPLVSLVHPRSDSGAIFIYQTPRIQADWLRDVSTFGDGLQVVGTAERSFLAKLLVVTVAGFVVGNKLFPDANQPLMGEEQEDVGRILGALEPETEEQNRLYLEAIDHALKSCENGLLLPIKIAADHLLASKQLNGPELQRLWLKVRPPDASAVASIFMWANKI